MLKAWVSLGSPDLTLTGIPRTSRKSKRCWIWCHTFHARQCVHRPLDNFHGHVRARLMVSPWCSGGCAGD
eukprot:2078759-Amphidinium_carterae.1